MWSVKWGIFSSGYIPKNAWKLLAQTYFYSDSKKDVMKAYQYALLLEISESAAQYYDLQLFGKTC
jgi:hypothetical protein